MITPKLYRRRSSFISQPIHLPHQKRNVQFFWSEDGQYLFQPPLKKIDKGGTLFGTLAPIKGTFKNSRLKRLPRWIHARARADSQQQFKTNVSEPQWDGWGHFGCRTTKESIDLAFPPPKKKMMINYDSYYERNDKWYPNFCYPVLGKVWGYETKLNL